MRIFLAALAVLLLPATGQAEAPAALVMGNTRAAYIAESPTLVAADDDPLLVSTSLTTSGHKVRTLINTNPTAFGTELTLLASRASAGSLNILYVTGHGFLDSNGDRLFLAEADRRGVSVVGLAEIVSILAAVPSKRFLIIWDACRNNPFGEQPVPSFRVRLPPNISVLYSASPGELADDAPPDAVHTVFAVAIAEGLKDKRTTLVSLGETVAREVEPTSVTGQHVQLVEAPVERSVP